MQRARPLPLVLPRVFLPLILLLAACGGESATALADAHRAASSAALARIAALAPIVEKQPALGEDRWKLPDGLRLDCVPFGERIADDGTRTPNPAYNTAIAFAEHLAKPGEAASLEWQSGNKDTFLLLVDKSDRWLLETAAFLEMGRGRYGSEPVLSNLKQDLDWLERTRYLLVLRLPTRQPPGLVMQELRAGEMKTFTPGRVTGDALLYDLEKSALVGGFPIDVTSAASEEVRNANVHGQLAGKLAEAVNEFVLERVSAVGRALR